MGSGKIFGFSIYQKKKLNEIVVNKKFLKRNYRNNYFSYIFVNALFDLGFGTGVSLHCSTSRNYRFGLFPSKYQSNCFKLNKIYPLEIIYVVMEWRV